MTTKNMYARYCSIVQSSGMGKSRLVDEFSKDHFLVLVNLAGRVPEVRLALIILPLWSFILAIQTSRLLIMPFVSSLRKAKLRRGETSPFPGRAIFSFHCSSIRRLLVLVPITGMTALSGSGSV
jgi:hypothetical protein